MRLTIILTACGVLIALLTFLFGSGIINSPGKSGKEIHTIEKNIIVPDEKEEQETRTPPIEERSDTIPFESVVMSDESEKQKTSQVFTEPSTKKISKIEGSYTSPVNIKSHRLTYSSRLCDFDIIYPQIYGLADEAFQSLMNDYILQETNIKSVNLEKVCKEYEEEHQKFKRDYDLPSSWTVDYKVHFNRNGILSLTVTTLDYWGGAHGMEYMDSFNFDLNEANIIKFDDLFAFQYLEKIYNLLREHVDEEHKWEVDNPEGFYLTENDIVVFYGMYQIAAGAAGVVEIPISICTVKQYLDPKGPLAKVISW